MRTISSMSLSDSHLQAIGSVTAEWSYAESLLESLIWHVAGLSNHQGYCVTTHIGSETRIHILESLAEAKLLAPTLKKELKDRIADIRRLRTERNNIIHYLWIDPNPPQIGLIASAMKPRRKRAPHAVKVTAKGILKISNTRYPTKKVREVANQITQLCFDMSSLLQKMRQSESDRQHLGLAAYLREHPELAHGLGPTTTAPQSPSLPSPP
jgi:hypothetical protein